MCIDGSQSIEQQLEITRQVRVLLVSLQAEHPQIHIPGGFEARLMARIHQQKNGLELLDLSSKVFGAWLVEVINLISGLIGTLGVNPPIIPEEKVL